MSERATPPGLASVIVPSSGGLETLRRCVAELARHARPPWELIVVSDGVGPIGDYLAGVADVAPFRVEVARPASPAASGGFPASCAPGLAAARGEYLVLLADVAVVTDGWLAQLVGLAESGPRADLTGPVSNAAEPPQRVLAGSHGDAGELGRFASRWRHEHRGQWLTVESLSGPCLLLKRRVLESLGGPEGRGVDLGLSAPGVGVVTPERLAADPSLESRRGWPPSGGPPHVWVAHRCPYDPNGFQKKTVQRLMRRHLSGGPSPQRQALKQLLRSDEWLASELVDELGVSRTTMHAWMKAGWIEYRRVPGQARRLYACWADAAELSRLRELARRPRHWYAPPLPAWLTTPRARASYVPE